MEENKLVVEYLVSIKDDSHFRNCSTIKSFNNLISSNSNIKIENKKIKFNTCEYVYKIQLDKNDKLKIFHVTFIANIDPLDEVRQLSEFENFLKEFRVMFTRNGSINMVTLIDNVSSYYSKKAYPIINKIENLMRKLLTKFMLVNASNEWHIKNIPSDVKSMKSKYTEHSYLYGLDFIGLSQFLFNKYPDLSTDEFLSKVHREKGFTNINYEDIEKKSNWERYFNEHVECSEKELENKWEKLYCLRCDIAHNNEFNKSNYEDVKKYAEYVEPILIKAINELDKIEIKDEEKVKLSEYKDNISKSSLFLYGNEKLEDEVVEYLKKQAHIYKTSSISKKSVEFNKVIIPRDKQKMYIETVRSKYGYDKGNKDDDK